MASLNYFQSLSIELIEHILLQFTRTSDLLSLALTERTLCSIIIPNFLEYCRLKFCVNRLDVWEYLNKRPLFCSRVRHLELWSGFPISGRLYYRLEQPKTMVPRVLQSNVEDGSLDRPWPDMMPTSSEACGALRKMCNLKRIAFNNSVDEEIIPLHDVVAFALAVYDASRDSIENISFDMFIPAEQPTESEFLPLLGRILSDSNWLSSLKTCHIHLIFDDPHYSNSEFDANFEKALSQMMNVTHLRLIIDNRFNRPFGDIASYWPKIEWLCLREILPYGLSFDQHFPPDFIRNHPRLHTLFVTRKTILAPSQMDSEGMFEVPTPPLKSLHYLPTGPYPGSLRQCLPSSVLRNLSHLTYAPVPDDLDFNLFDKFESLESCVINVAYLDDKKQVIEIAQSMSRGCRNLKKLWFKSRYLYYLKENDAVFSIFRGLSSLTHLLGISSDNRQFPGDEGGELLKRLYTDFPKLRYTDCCPDMDFEFVMYVELRRNDVQQQMEYEFLDSKSEPESCNHHQWGGFDITI